jgi:serine/threonine protein phosphatase 1
MRTIVVGDIHGCYEELLQLLTKVQLTEADCLIALGDIVDRGKDSLQVYDFLKNRSNTIVLMGNHECRHLHQTLSYSQEIVKLQFGDRYEEFVEWIADLPYYYEIEEAILVHAAIENDIPIETQKEEILCGSIGGIPYLERLYGEAYWSKFYKGAKPVIFGHYAVDTEPLIREQEIYGIDTGAFYGGRLTALVLPSFEVVQVQSRRNYWRDEMVKWQVPVMKAKPWPSYHWRKIKAICADSGDFSNVELSLFMAQKRQWCHDLLALAPAAIAQIEQKLSELITLHGSDNFQQATYHLTYADLLDQAHTKPLTPHCLQQALPTPEKWLQVMTELEINF